jgi:hypothetical protein
MNHTIRSALPTTDHAPPATRTKPTVQSLLRWVTDHLATANDRSIRLTWQRLDRSTSVATLGLILVDPRTALEVARALGPRSRLDLEIYQPPSAATRGPEVSR